MWKKANALKMTNEQYVTLEGRMGFPWDVPIMRTGKDRRMVIFRWVNVCLLVPVLGLSACAMVPNPALRPPAGEREGKPLYPGIVTVGDILQVGYFFNNKIESEFYRIGVGDSLRVEVVDHPELTREEIVVLPDGRISLNLVGSVKAVGKTVEEIAAEVAARYAETKIREPKAVVSIMKGQQRLKLFMQYLGGDRGAGKLDLKVYDEQGLDLPFIPHVAVGRPITDIRRDIREAYKREFGDQLEVTVNLGGRTLPSVYVMGEVKKPGAFELVRSSNLLASVAMAGGFSDTANEGEVLVIRFKENGSYNHWSFDLKDGLFSSDQPGSFMLQGNDVVYVAKSTIAKVDLFVQQYIRGVMPVDFGVGAAIPINP